MPNRDGQGKLAVQGKRITQIIVIPNEVRNLWNPSGEKFEIAAHDSGVSQTRLPRRLGMTEMD
jgi:hypothetical protein